MFNNNEMLAAMIRHAGRGKPVRSDRIRLAECADAPEWAIDVLDADGNLAGCVIYYDKRQAEEDFEVLQTVTKPGECCLVDIRCPHCGATGPFLFETVMTMRWTDDGTDFGGSYEQNCEIKEGGHGYCEVCDHGGPSDEFKVEEDE